jgi:protein-L-isoaspartate(D-aspartate) O-methyltransferase
MYTRQELFDHLEQEIKVLENKAVRKAFKEIDRGDFVADDYQVEAYEDYALPAGFNQTMLKPSFAAFMLELLDAQVGDKVLNIGSGSGWTSALLSKLVGDSGNIVGLESVGELVEASKSNVAKYKLTNIEFRKTEKTIGLAAKGPYNRILVNGSLNEFPETLIDQLAIGGVVVVPLEDSIVKIEKKSKDKKIEKEYPGFSVAPLV